MLSVYLASLGFGGVLIGASVLLGGDKDLDADHELGHDGANVLSASIGGEPLTIQPAQIRHRGKHLRLPFLSLRFWSFATAAFGLTGSLLELAFPSTVAVFAFASFMGLALGTAAATAFQVLKSERVTADISLSRFVGKEAKVIIPVRPGLEGQIAFQTMGGRLELRALSRDGVELAAGSTVLCAHIDDGVAWVTSMPTAPARVPARRRLPE